MQHTHTGRGWHQFTDTGGINSRTLFQATLVKILHRHIVCSHAQPCIATSALQPLRTTEARGNTTCVGHFCDAEAACVGCDDGVVVGHPAEVLEEFLPKKKNEKKTAGDTGSICFTFVF